MPSGYGAYFPDTSGVNINITSDGKGGINIKAETDNIDRQVKRTEETTHRIRDETSDCYDEKRINYYKWIGLGVALSIFVYVMVKRYLNTN